MFTKRAAAAASFPLVALSVGARAMQMVACREVAWHVRRPLVCRVGRHARRAETERAGGERRGERCVHQTLASCGRVIIPAVACLLVLARRACNGVSVSCEATVGVSHRQTRAGRTTHTQTHLRTRRDGPTGTMGRSSIHRDITRHDAR